MKKAPAHQDKGRAKSDSSSSIEDDSISFAEADSLNHDITELLADQQQIETTQPLETSEDMLAGADRNSKIGKNHQQSFL